VDAKVVVPSTQTTEAICWLYCRHDDIGVHSCCCKSSQHAGVCFNQARLITVSGRPSGWLQLDNDHSGARVFLAIHLTDSCNAPVWCCGLWPFFLQYTAMRKATNQSTRSGRWHFQLGYVSRFTTLADIEFCWIPAYLQNTHIDSNCDRQ
jgi:hypothetical protein